MKRCAVGYHSFSSYRERNLERKKSIYLDSPYFFVHFKSSPCTSLLSLTLTYESFKDLKNALRDEPVLGLQITKSLAKNQFKIVSLLLLAAFQVYAR